MVRIAIALACAVLITCGILAQRAYAKTTNNDDKILERVERDHFHYFTANQDPNTGLISDNNSGAAPASIAAVGFALSVYPVAVERGWISRDEARDWTLKVLTTLANAPQGPQASGTAGYHGYFYHMLDPKTALRARSPQYWDSELSSIDTALLMAGVDFARNYYTGSDPREMKIRELATKLYDGVEWPWMAQPDGTVSLAWTPESGMNQYQYRGYSEAVLIYILGMGSKTHPLPAQAWQSFIGNAKTETDYGQTFIQLPGDPLFTYQYPLSWIDFRGIYDAKNRELGFDYFENSRRATIAQHEYAIANPNHWAGYDANNWGLTACDGPGNFTRNIDGTDRTFSAYRERGAPHGYDDGTIAPTAALSSMPFTPDISLATLKYWLANYPELYRADGFVDAFNPTLDRSRPEGWFTPHSIGIDQGPIIMMIENYRTGFFWKTLSRSDNIQRGLNRAGFTGGWLDAAGAGK